MGLFWIWKESFVSDVLQYWLYKAQSSVTTYNDKEIYTESIFHIKWKHVSLSSHLSLNRYSWWGFQAWDTLQDSTDNSSIDNAETNLEWQEYFSQFWDTTDALPCHIHLPVCLWIMNPHGRAPKKNTSHGNEELLQDTTHLLQRPCYPRGSLCQDPAGNQTTKRPPDHHHKETQTAVVWSCLPFIRSGQNYLARHSGKITSGNGQAWNLPSPRGQWRTGKNGGHWRWNHLWCPNNPRSKGIDDEDEMIMHICA